MLVTAMFVLLASVGQPGTPPTPVPAPAVAPVPAGWTWTAGREEHYDATITQSASSEGLLVFTMNDEQRVGFSTKVVSVASDGSAKVEFRLDSLRVTITPSPTTKPITVDSTAAPGSEEFDPNAPARALVGATLTLTMAKDGGVQAVAGLPELRALVKRAFSDPPVLADLAEPLLAAINDRSVESAVGNAFCVAETPMAGPNLSLRGVGMLLAKPTTTREVKAGQLEVKRSVEYSVATPNADSAAKSFDIAVREGGLTSTAVAVPGEGKLASFSSSLSLKLAFTPRAGVKDLSPMTRTLTQTVRVGPRAAPTPAGPGTP